MGCAEAENISKYLKTKEIQLPSNNKWLLDCINWYKYNLDVRNIYHSLEDYVCIQWLLSDLRDVQHRCLPTSCKDSVTELPGKYCVQVNWVRDISQPCYTQLQAIKNNDIADSNEHVSAEESKKQNWEPSPKRVLMMEITDGLTTLKAIEHSPIPRLTEPFIPGFKVVLTGPIECRKGILFLKSNNVSLLGGEVDHIGDLYSKENLLSRCLNIASTENNNSSSNNNSRRDAPLPPPPPPAFDNRPLQHQTNFNDMDQLPDSTSFIDSNHVQDQDVMMEEDDDLLCQLPDTMFNDDNIPPINTPSPVLGQGSPEHVQSSTIESIPRESYMSNDRSKNFNRPKLFPSMEDVRSENTNIKSSFPNSSTLTSSNRNDQDGSYMSDSSSSTRLPMASSLVSRNSELDESVNIPPGLGRRINNPSAETFANSHQSHRTLDDSISNQIDDVLNKTSNVSVYPQFKRKRVKVLSITKLKIRNGNWTCAASVTMGDVPQDVTFCNKALEKLFGTSAAEVEVLRSEMSKNQSLKEKINSILKTGQTKLKLLNCMMIVEYTSEECTPNIVSIEEE